MPVLPASSLEQMKCRFVVKGDHRAIECHSLAWTHKILLFVDPKFGGALVVWHLLQPLVPQKSARAESDFNAVYLVCCCIKTSKQCGSVESFFFILGSASCWHQMRWKCCNASDDAATRLELGSSFAHFALRTDKSPWERLIDLSSCLPEEWVERTFPTKPLKIMANLTGFVERPKQNIQNTFLWSTNCCKFLVISSHASSLEASQRHRRCTVDPSSPRWFYKAQGRIRSL